MSSIPPISEVIDASVRVVFPAFGVTALTGYGLPKLLGRRFEYIAAAVAVLLGALAANWLRGVFDFRFDSEVPLTVAVFIKEFGRAIWYWTTAPDAATTELLSTPRPGRYWIPCAVALTTIGGLYASLLSKPKSLEWITKFCLCCIAAKLVVPASLAHAQLWLVPLAGIIMFAEWVVFERLCLSLPTGCPSVCTVIAALGASAVMIHAHSARLTDAATILFACSLGLVVAARWGHAKEAGAATFGVIALVSIQLTGYHETFSDVPMISFALPAFASLFPGLILLVPERWRIGFWGWVSSVFLVGIPTLISVIITMRSESLSF